MGRDDTALIPTALGNDHFLASPLISQLAVPAYESLRPVSDRSVLDTIESQAVVIDTIASERSRPQHGPLPQPPTAFHRFVLDEGLLEVCLALVAGDTSKELPPLLFHIITYVISLILNTSSKNY